MTLIPRELYGTSLPVSLRAVPASNPSLGEVTVGSWSIKVPAKPRNTNLVLVQGGAAGRSTLPDEPEILANGYMFTIGEKLTGDQLYLVVNLNVVSTGGPEPAPTDR